MIYRLQRRFILICTVSVLTVVSLVFCIILLLNVTSLNRNMDLLADRISEGGGKFPSAHGEPPHADREPPKAEQSYNFITPETPYSTRHFTVLFDQNGEVENIFTESIYSIDEAQALTYAKQAVAEAELRGWLSHYRYKVRETELGKSVVFVDGSMSRSSLMQTTTISGFVLLGCAALVLILIFLLSKRAVKPIAESYERQKQFVTDANHELKTPLTLILTNLDIAESELGKNEWLEDIRSEGHRMTELVNQLVALSRMDEEGQALQLQSLCLGTLVADAVAEFRSLAESKGQTVKTDVEPNVPYRGDEALLTKLVFVLLDNAVKYCDRGGEIHVALHRGRRVILRVENTYAAVGEIELQRLFDRFYRADKARKFTGGYGIGLSMAKAIVEKHGGEITAYQRDDAHIGFKVIF